ncbi:hypothetical protein VNI00_010398 [Paramarasmius palmivorus]|uniref:Uncharacterized protein n=1 Tax=Paramarasmius palmivorus TaxID=297713 RepID=A0AAW0CKH9_9AGAR
MPFDVNESFFGKAHHHYGPNLEASVTTCKFGRSVEPEEMSQWTPLRRRPSSTWRTSPSSSEESASWPQTYEPSSISLSTDDQAQPQRRKRKTPPTDESHPYSKRFDDRQKEFLYKFLFVDGL